MGKIAIVFTAHGIPEIRLRDHFAWNETFYLAFSKIFVIADKQYGVPSRAECLIYPRPLEIFNLAKTSNYGIRRACDEGCDIICKTDVDCVFSAELVQKILSLSPAEGLCPIYQRRASPGKPATAWPRGCGTIALHRDAWFALCGYDERMMGYGIEDGDLYHRSRAIARVTRDGWIDHIEHGGAWNPNNNPPRRTRNRMFHQIGGWSDPRWGLHA